MRRRLRVLQGGMSGLGFQDVSPGFRKLGFRFLSFGFGPKQFCFQFQVGVWGLQSKLAFSS